MENNYYVQIQGKNDKGPWKVRRIDNGKIVTEREAQRFGELCNYVIRFLNGNEFKYDINYKGSHGFIFDDIEERIIFHLVDRHNRLLSIKRNLEEVLF